MSAEMAKRADEDARGLTGDTYSGEDFSRVGCLLASSISMTTRLDRVVEQAIELLGAERGSIMLIDDDAGELVVKASHGLSARRGFRVAVGEGISGWVALHGEPLVLQDVVSDKRFSGTNPSLKSALAVPLRVEGKVIGVLNVSNTARRRRFDHFDLEHLISFADMAAVIIENARLYEALRKKHDHVEKELQMASRIQKSIISTHMPCASVRMVSRLMPASAVGGDFFSVIPLYRDSRFCFHCSPDTQDSCQKLHTDFCHNKFGLMIGDVANKGMPAALIMSVLTTILYEVGRRQSSPRDILNEANAAFRRFFNESQYGFATLFYGFYDGTDNTLTYTRAGHEPPLLLRGRGGECEYLEGEGFPVGLMEDGSYQETTVKLEREDRVLLYTDGLTGAINSRGEILGRKRLVELVRSLVGEGIEAFIDALADEVMVFSGDAAQPDDIAVMVLEVEDPYDLTMAVDSDVLQIRYVISSVLDSLQGFEGLRDPVSLRLCLEELLNNAIEHGNHRDLSKKVYITVRSEPHRATIRVRDEGEGFDFQRFIDGRTEEPDPLSERGRGIVIIRHFADELLYNREGNEATLVFKAGCG